MFWFDFYIKLAFNNFQGITTLNRLYNTIVLLNENSSSITKKNFV